MNKAKLMNAKIEKLRFKISNLPEIRFLLILSFVMSLKRKKRPIKKSRVNNQKLIYKALSDEKGKELAHKRFKMS